MCAQILRRVQFIARKREAMGLWHNNRRRERGAFVRSGIDGVAVRADNLLLRILNLAGVPSPRRFVINKWPLSHVRLYLPHTVNRRSSSSHTSAGQMLQLLDGGRNLLERANGRHSFSGNAGNFWQVCVPRVVYPICRCWTATGRLDALKWQFCFQEVRILLLLSAEKCLQNETAVILCWSVEVHLDFISSSSLPASVSGPL